MVATSEHTNLFTCMVVHTYYFIELSPSYLRRIGMECSSISPLVSLSPLSPACFTVCFYPVSVCRLIRRLIAFRFLERVPHSSRFVFQATMSASIHPAESSDVEWLSRDSCNSFCEQRRDQFRRDAEALELVRDELMRAQKETIVRGLCTLNKDAM